MKFFFWKSQCRVPNCKVAAHTRGLCQKHYGSWHARGMYAEYILAPLSKQEVGSLGGKRGGGKGGFKDRELARRAGSIGGKKRRRRASHA